MLNVTNHDYENERKVLSYLEGSGFRLVNHNTGSATSHFDAEIESSTGRKIIAEIKSRTRYSGDKLNDFGGAYIPCDKLWSTVKLARSTGKDYGFFVGCSDGVWAAKIFDSRWSWREFVELVSGLEIDSPSRNVGRGQALNDSFFAYKIRLFKIEKPAQEGETNA